MPHSREEKLDCITREIAMRDRVYPRFVRQGRMREADALRELQMMREIAADYEALDPMNQVDTMGDAIGDAMEGQ